MPHSRTVLPALTGLRFFLAAAIVAFHYAQPLKPVMPAAISNLVGSGFLAVDVFFVLSGFVMAYNYLGDGGMRVTRREFWSARLARIGPVYWIGAMLFAPIAFARFWTGDALAFGALFASMGLLVQAWIPPLALLWNPPGWSLSVEAFFYAVFPRLGMFLWRTTRPYHGAVVCWAILLGSATLISWLDPHPQSWPWDTAADSCDWTKLLNYNPLLRLPEFAAGILACRIWRAGASWQSRTWLEWLLPGAAAVLLAWRWPLDPDLTALGLFCPAIMAWVIVLARGEGVVARFLALPGCVRLGEWSYALYILHVPVWGLMLSANEENGGIADPNRWPFLMTTFIAALALSGVVHYLVEIPYRRAFLQALRPVATHD